jgi:holo-[acyl-carrier protein] synthase
MILGIGSDITDVRRIAKVIERHGDRFIDRVFTPAERARAERRRNRVETYAKRFAAKEACAKALGTGLRAGVWWRDMGVVNLPSGRPTMELTGGAKRRLEAITRDSRRVSTLRSPTKVRWRKPLSLSRPFASSNDPAAGGGNKKFARRFQPRHKHMGCLDKLERIRPATFFRVQLRAFRPEATRTRGARGAIFTAGLGY